jgi:iron complex transport system permease protein
MSGFVSGRGARLTPGRLFGALALCAGACAVVALIAPQLGVTMTKSGRALELLGMRAFDAGTEQHQVFMVRLPRVLAGVTISMFCSSASMLVQYTSDFADVSHMLGWMIGALDSVRLVSVQYAAAPHALGRVVLVFYARELNALAAGADVAASLGVAVARTETIVFVVASLLVGVSIAVAGPIGFIGLVVPHALRALLGPDHRLLLPASIFGGATLLVVCDTLARTITAPSPLPTGAVTAVLGGPFFIGILVRGKRNAALWGRA